MPIIFDVALEQLVRARLQGDSRTAGVMVDVCCEDGCICLIGRVDNTEQKQAAEFLVEGLTGVRSVLNQITVRD